MTNVNVHSDFAQHGEGDAHHHHQHEYKQSYLLGFALLLAGGFAGVEALAGWYSGSLALISDAGHMLTDSAALALAYFAQKMAARPASARLSFGYTRVEVVARCGPHCWRRAKRHPPRRWSGSLGGKRAVPQSIMGVPPHTCVDRSPRP